MEIDLVDVLGAGGFFLSLLGLYFIWRNHQREIRKERKDDSIIKITKKRYWKYSDDVRALELDIKNLGNRDDKLTDILVLYKRKDKEPISPSITLGERGIKISARDNVRQTFKFRFQNYIWKEIESEVPVEINIIFKFLNEKIVKEFKIGENSFVDLKD